MYTHTYIHTYIYIYIHRRRTLASEAGAAAADLQPLVTAASNNVVALSINGHGVTGGQRLCQMRVCAPESRTASATQTGIIWHIRSGV